MRLLKKEGRIQDFQFRGKKNSVAEVDWKFFIQKGKEYYSILERQDPDIVQRLNEKIRQEKENERIQKEKADQLDNWIWNGEEYIPEAGGYDDEFHCTPLTEEERKLFKEHERVQYEEWKEKRK